LLGDDDDADDNDDVMTSRRRSCSGFHSASPGTETHNGFSPDDFMNIHQNNSVEKLRSIKPGFHTTITQRNATSA